MAVIEGVLKEIKISEERENKQGKYFQYDLGINDVYYTGYIKSEGIPLVSLHDKDGDLLAEGGMVQITTAEQGGKTYVKTEAIVILNKKEKVPETTPSEPKKPITTNSGGLGELQLARAYALQATANMVGRIEGTQIKSDQAMKMADVFTDYILFGKK